MARTAKGLLSRADDTRKGRLSDRDSGWLQGSLPLGPLLVESMKLNMQGMTEIFASYPHAVHRDLWTPGDPR